MQLSITLDLFERLDRFPPQASLIINDWRISRNPRYSIEILSARRAFVIGIICDVFSQAFELVVDGPQSIATLNVGRTDKNMSLLKSFCKAAETFEFQRYHL